jgi:acetyl esterase
MSGQAASTQSGTMPDDIDPQLAAVLAHLAQMGMVTPDPSLVGIEAARRVNEAYFGYIAEPMPPVHKVERLAIAGSSGPLDLKIVWPQDGLAESALLYFHGGGYAFATLHTHERLMRQLVLASGAVVIGVEYRRTPEHPFPAALEDAVAAWRWLLAGGEGRFGDIGRGVFGDSAGAHLALTLALKLRELGLHQPDVLGLAYGMYDASGTSASHARHGDGRYGLSTAKMAWFWDKLVPNPADRSNPMIMPLLADLHGLPPMAVFIAEKDCLADDSQALVARLEAANMRHSLDVFAGMIHGFIQLGALLPAADAALALIGQRLAQVLGEVE